MNQICQSCQRQFPLLVGDAEFYAKIQVPTPTFCFHCRLQRRMAWRNERSLYKRKCNAPGHDEELISMYPAGSPHIIYDAKYWWSDSWDPLSSGREYEFSRPFLEQFSELLKTTPLPALSILNSVNSDYTNFVDGNKNCYLVFGAGWNENVSYGNKIMGNRDSQDLLADTKCELCHECVNCVECYRVLHSTNCKNCSDSYLLHNCRNCQNCFGCVNLVNKSYCIFNEQYTKEEYKKKLEELQIHTRSGIEKAREFMRQNVYLRSIHRYANIFNSVDVTGDNINNCKNCKMSFDLYQNAEDSNYLYGSLDLKDTYDANGAFQTDLSYELQDCNVGNRNLSVVTAYNCNDAAYSLNCHSCSNIFGCIGLRSKQYCILNKQYSKEEYEELLPKVIEHMNAMPYADRKGRIYRYGEFFPIELAPYAYNETIAQEYFTLTPAEASEKGFPWREDEKKSHAITLDSSQLPETIDETDPKITEAIIACAHKGDCQEQCTKGFRITSGELQFYEQLNVPPPLLCPNCRHYKRLKERNSLDLWKRKCQCQGKSDSNSIYRNTATHAHGSEPCSNEFETTFNPTHPEIVYCENCYQAEVS